MMSNFVHSPYIVRFENYLPSLSLAFPPCVGTWQNINFPRPSPLLPLLPPLLTCVTEHFIGDTVCLLLLNVYLLDIFGQALLTCHWLRWALGNHMIWEGLPDVFVFVGLGGTRCNEVLGGATTGGVFVSSVGEHHNTNIRSILSPSLLVQDIVRCLCIWHKPTSLNNNRNKISCSPYQLFLPQNNIKIWISKYCCTLVPGIWQ